MVNKRKSLAISRQRKKELDNNQSETLSDSDPSPTFSRSKLESRLLEFPYSPTPMEPSSESDEFPCLSLSPLAPWGQASANQRRLLTSLMLISPDWPKRNRGQSQKPRLPSRTVRTTNRRVTPNLQRRNPALSQSLKDNGNIWWLPRIDVIRPN
jgi:hypothetical protein